MAIPFFMVAGEAMNQAGITEKLVNFANILVGRFRGGLAYVNIVASMIFAGITGAAVADVSALGTIFIPSMEKEGYTRKYAAAVVAGSSIMGPIIPPSIVMVVYGAMTNTSVAAMFAGAIIPGVLIGLAQMGVVFVQARRRNFPQRHIEFTPKKFILSFRAAFLALIMPLIILSGILFGLTTPTEAAAIAALYAMVLGVVRLSEYSPFKKFLHIFKGATYQYASLLVIMGSASILGWVLSRNQAHTVLLKLIFGVTENPTGILMIVLGLPAFRRDMARDQRHHRPSGAHARRRDAAHRLQPGPFRDCHDRDGQYRPAHPASRRLPVRRFGNGQTLC